MTLKNRQTIAGKDLNDQPKENKIHCSFERWVYIYIYIAKWSTTYVSLFFFYKEKLNHPKLCARRLMT